jgi:hypothetical protein
MGRTLVGTCVPWESVYRLHCCYGRASGLLSGALAWDHRRAPARVDPQDDESDEWFSRGSDCYTADVTWTTFDDGSQVHGAGLERLLRGVMPERLKQRPFGLPAMIRVLANELSLDSELLYELDQLRLIRSQLVHGVELPTSAHIANATHQLDALISEIERRRDSQ